MNSNVSKKIQSSFRPRARLLQLLGDELIGSARLAVFELVKNAYDADANEVIIEIDLDPAQDPNITIIDDGEGMTLDVLQSIWLVPGDDHRKQQRKKNHRTPKHHRLPLGEKGLGRFAAHKLGNRITLVTRAANSDECVVDIDWNKLIAHDYLDEAPVTIEVRPPGIFTGKETGTWIQIQQLRNDWKRGDVRRLHNQITSICSPFAETGAFSVELRVANKEKWFDDLPDVAAILDSAPWEFSFRLDKDGFDWTYEFRQIPGFLLEGRTEKRSEGLLLLPPNKKAGTNKEAIIIDKSTVEGIGPITGKFYVYDRDREVRTQMANIRMVENYLDTAGGIRIYRDNIRIYNYGEPSDDWLGLDTRRVNSLARRISNNIVIGAIHLSLQESTKLTEKTNREGFVENETYALLQKIVLGILYVLEAERRADKLRIRNLATKPGGIDSIRIEKHVQLLRAALKKQGLENKFENYISNIEKNYHTMQETLLSAGMSGLNLAVIFHEIERGVRMLHTSISEDKDIESAASQAHELMEILSGFATILGRDRKKEHSAKKLVENVVTFNKIRFRHHRIHLVCPLLENSDNDFSSQFAFSLVLGALNNLIDNALYWLRVRWLDTQNDNKLPQRKLYIGISHDFTAGPSIIVADNGTSLREDDPVHLVQPFFTRKPEGMGLGLYYAALAMELNGGQLVFPQREKVAIPAEFDGAVIALIFKESNT